MKREKMMLRVVAILFSTVLIIGLINAILQPSYIYNKHEAFWVHLDKEWVKTSQDSAIYVIPEEYDMSLMAEINTGFHKLCVYLDNTLLLEYNGSKQDDTVSTIWVDIPAHSNGKTLEVRGFEGERHLDAFLKQQCELGTGFDLLESFISTSMVCILYLAFSLMVGMTLFVLSFLLKDKLSANNRKAMLDLSLLLILSGIWVITDSEVPSIAHWNLPVVNYLNFISLTVIPLSLVLFIQHMSWNRYHMNDVIAHLTQVMVLFYLLIHVVFGISLFKGLIVFYVLIFVTICISIYYTVQEIKTTRHTRTRYILIGIVSLIVSATLSFAIYWYNTSYNYSFVIVIGMLVFIVCLAIPIYQSTISNIYDSMKSNVYKEMAYRDVLTGLNNRTALNKSLDEWANKERKGIVVLDLNDLKRINDEYGHSVGDEIIVQMAKNLKMSFGKIGACYRIGGDEFVVLLSNKNMEQVEQAVMEMQEACEVYNEQSECKIRIAWGYTIETNRVMTFEEMFDEADQIMYQRKKNQKRMVFEPNE